MYTYNWGRVFEIPGTGMRQFHDLGKYVERLGGLGVSNHGIVSNINL
jgi:hypothetical protein